MLRNEQLLHFWILNQDFSNIVLSETLGTYCVCLD